MRCLEVAAQILAALGSTTVAVELVAAAIRRREILDAPRPDVEQPEVEDMLDAARCAIGASAFETAWHAGHELSVPGAMDVAAVGLGAALETASR